MTKGFYASPRRWGIFHVECLARVDITESVAAMDTGVIIGIVGVACTALGILISWLLVKEKRPLYVISTTALRGIAHPHLSLSFNGRQIPNIFAARFVLWNSGRQELRREDIPGGKAAPTLRVAEGVEILSLDARTTTGDHTGALVDLGGGAVAVSFDYLNRGDAVLGEVLCTSPAGAYPAARFSGAIKGAKLARGDAEVGPIQIISPAVGAILFGFWTVKEGFKVYEAAMGGERWADLLKVIGLAGGAFVMAALATFSFYYLITRRMPGAYRAFLKGEAFPPST